MNSNSGIYKLLNILSNSELQNLRKEKLVSMYYKLVLPSLFTPAQPSHHRFRAYLNGKSDNPCHDAYSDSHIIH